MFSLRRSSLHSKSSLAELLISIFLLIICSRQCRLFFNYFLKILPLLISQFQSHFHPFSYLLQQHSTSSYQNLYQSWFNQTSRIIRRYILKELLQRTDLYDRWGWNSVRTENVVHRWNLFFIIAVWALLLRLLNRLNQAHPDYLG